jgi:hypothetical protein
MRKARPTVTGGTLGARSSLRRSRAKLAGKNPADRSLQGSLSLRAQKGAVTRGANRLGKARAASTMRMAARAGVIRGGRKVAAKPVAAAPPKDYKRGRSAALGYKPKADGTRPATSGARVLSARLNASQRKKAAEARQRYGVRSTAQRARTRAGSYDPAKQGGGRVTFRSRLAAKKAYLMRAVATKNIANRKASDFTSGLEYQGSLKAKSATVSQGNLLTGDTERIKRVRVRSASPKSAIMGVLKREAAKSGRPMAPRKPVTPRAPRYAYRKINRANANLDRASKAINKLEKRLEKTNTPKSQKALAKARKSAAVAFKARRLLNREPSRFYGRGSGRRVKSGAPRPSGTLAKPRNLKPGAIAAKKAKATASGARAARATANYNRAQKAAQEAQQRLNRRRSSKNQAAADNAQKTLRTAARAYRILVGLGGKKLAVARKPSPKGAGPRMKAARPAGTVAKPKGLKVGATAARSNPQPQRKRKVDYAGAVKLLSRQKAAINRLKNPQQTFNGNAAYARQVDVRTAKSTPTANAQREIRALYGEYRRAQSSAKSQYASQEVRTRAASKLSTLRKQIRKAAQAARAFKPEYSAETRRRFQAAQARRKP